MAKTPVRTVEISAEQSGRRLDNYLSGVLKTAPKSFIYRIIRRGEVRVNGSRSRPDTRLLEADKVRIPPMLMPDKAERIIAPDKFDLIDRSILFEDDEILVLNKPAGFAVHGGSGLRFGVIDILRALRPQNPNIELAHRLDRDTSGCLVCAKSYPSLRRAQQDLGAEESRKTYLALVVGTLSHSPLPVTLSLRTSQAGGEKRTVVAADGKPAFTEFSLLEAYPHVSLVQARITTGRTHQIRVHAAAIGHVIAGDKKYGDRIFNEQIRQRGLQRMFLHAAAISLRVGSGARRRRIEAPLPSDLDQFLAKLR